jgi:hypothetical protein
VPFHRDTTFFFTVFFFLLGMGNETQVCATLERTGPGDVFRIDLSRAASRKSPDCIPQKKQKETVDHRKRGTQAGRVFFPMRSEKDKQTQSGSEPRRS